MHPALRETAHRPWPLSADGWRWRQSWLDLGFIHYRTDAAKLQAKIPEGLKMQEFDGTAWIGLVPFRMHGVMRRPFPPIPGLLSFPELNLRTYVEVGGKAGVWFFSLDADSAIAVAGGRRIYRLPYFRARMSHRWNVGWVEFASERIGSPERFAARYRGIRESSFAAAGSFEHWIAERYCLYSVGASGELRRVDVHHAPWPLQRAEVVLEENGVLSGAGIAVLDSEPVCHFSRGVDVVSFASKRVDGISRKMESMG